MRAVGCRNLLCIASIAVLVLVSGLVLQPIWHKRVLPHRESLSSFPLQFDGWTGRDISVDQTTVDSLKPDEFLIRDYEDTGQVRGLINLFIQYSPADGLAMIHREEGDMPRAWVVTSQETVQLARPDRSSFSANRDVFSNAGNRELVIYWYQAQGRAVASQRWARYYLIADSIRMNRRDGGMVRLMTQMKSDESTEAAQSRLMTLGSSLIPILDSYIPR